ncbi:MAG: hypothetical protein QOD77_227 [Thermoplasmata archaeon]|jgi:hypothetical protein|nr:hypothetical protein [Thermoplasmata archaeon]
MNEAEPLACPACGRNDFRDEQGRGGHLATVQDDTHRIYREDAGLTSAQDLARLLAPAPQPYSVPRPPTPRTTTDDAAEPWRDPEPRVHAPRPVIEPERVPEPEAVPPPQAPPRPVRVPHSARAPTRRGPSPLGIALGILGAAALAVLAAGVGRDPIASTAPEVRMGGPSGSIPGGMMR